MKFKSSRLINIVRNRTIRRKNGKKLRYFGLPPNLAHRKLLDLANYVPSKFQPSSLVFPSTLLPCSIRFLRASIQQNIERSQGFLILSRILEDNKQNKRKNRGKKTVRIYACQSPIRLNLHIKFLAALHFRSIFELHCFAQILKRNVYYYHITQNGQFFCQNEIFFKRNINDKK